MVGLRAVLMTASYTDGAKGRGRLGLQDVRSTSCLYASCYTRADGARNLGQAVFTAIPVRPM